MNVVVILMDSISSEYLSCTYQEKPLMPYMHLLIEESCYFENIYSAGIHTNNGIVTTLYGFPTQFDRTVIPTDIIYHTGLPVNLKRQGYHNLFFLTGNPNYDNMRQFLLGNGFDRIYSRGELI